MKNISALVVLAATLCTTGTASAIDLSRSLGIGTKAIKGLTLSDEDVAKAAEGACKAYDEKNPIARSGSKYAKRLAKITKGLQHEDGMDLDFKVYKVRDVNAFAMANGCVRVFAGLMDVASDDEIRAVIGHEIGHVKLGHTKKEMKVAILASAAREGVAENGGKAGAVAQSDLGNIAEAFVNAQYSQEQESDADAYGYEFMVRHHYDPKAMVSMLKTLDGKGGLFSSHPSSPERVNSIEELIAENG